MSFQNKLSAHKQRFVFLRGLLTTAHIRLFLLMLCFLMVYLGFITLFAKLALKNKRLAQKDWEYTFLISDFVRQLPMLNPIEGSKQYYYRIVYDPATAQNIMTYQSKASASEIISYYSLYFNASNYFSAHQSLATESVVKLRSREEGFDVYVKDYNEFRQVFVEYFPQIAK